MPVDDANAAVIATEVRLLKEDIGRRLDDHRDDIRSMRAEMSSNYVNQQAYQSDFGRISDRLERAESSIVEIRTSLATQFVDVHTHIDRRLDEITAQVKERFEEIVTQAREERVSRRWVVGIGVSVVLALIGSVTAVATVLLAGT